MSLDFFVLQSATGAGMALSRFLAAHPDIELPGRDDTDAAFRDGNEPTLLVETPRCQGMMLHDRVQLADDVPSRVARLVGPNAVFVQLVRDPVDVVLASHRRYLTAELTTQVAQQLGRPPIPGAIGRIRPVEEVYGWLRNRLLYHQQGARFAPTFASWRVLDAAGLWPEHVRDTMEQVYGWLGVDETFADEVFEQDFHGFASKMLHFSQQVLQVDGTELLVRMERTRDLARSTFSVELARVPTLDDRVPFALAGEVSLAATAAQWNQLSDHLQRALREQMPTFYAGPFLDEWIGQVSLIARGVAEASSEELPSTLRRTMREDLGGDLSKLAEVAPRVVASWSAWRASEPVAI